MTNTKPFTSIDLDLLADVQGGCGKKRCCCKNVNVVNNYAAPAAPAPAPVSTGASVDVSVGYQQA